MLNIYFVIAVMAGVFSFGLAGWVLLKKGRAAANQIFSLGIIILGSESILNGIILSGSNPIEVPGRPLLPARRAYDYSASSSGKKRRHSVFGKSISLEVF
jgi:hypothetical protein